MEIDGEYIEFLEVLNAKRHKELLASVSNIVSSMANSKSEVSAESIKNDLSQIILKIEKDSNEEHLREINKVGERLMAAIDQKLSLNETMLPKIEKAIVDLQAKNYPRWQFQIKRDLNGNIDTIIATPI